MTHRNQYFNPQGTDTGILVGNPTGITNFNDDTIGYTNKLYKMMQDLTWFPSEVSLTNEAKSFDLLTDNERHVFKLVFSNLNFLDSSQSDHVLDFRSHVTHKIAKAMFTLQSAQEDLHCDSYAAVLTELGNSDEVMSMFKTEPILMDRNTRVSELFARHINGNTSDEMIGSTMANVMLEGVLFMTSFSYVFHMSKTMQGSAQMVGFICRDEVTAHTAIFNNVFKTLRKENKISKEAIDRCYIMMRDAVNIELDFARHVTSNYPIQGITIRLLTDTIHNFANSRLTALGLDKMYPVTPETQLQKLVKQYSSDANSVKSNFFETKPRTYVRNGLDMDF